jgi:hypothetical protein
VSVAQAVQGRASSLKHAPVERQIWYGNVQSSAVRHATHVLVAESHRGKLAGHSEFRVHSTHCPFVVLQIKFGAEVQSAF